MSRLDSFINLKLSPRSIHLKAAGVVYQINVKALEAPKVKVQIHTRKINATFMFSKLTIIPMKRLCIYRISEVNVLLRKIQNEFLPVHYC